MAKDKFIPKYMKALAHIQKLVDEARPGERLPGVRDLMRRYKVSQSAIERCLDELERQGRVRRERARGVFVEGVEPRGTVLGVYTDGEMSPHANALFLQGARDEAARHDFQVADFGPKSEFDSQQVILKTMEELGFAGIITALSSANFLNIESDRALADFLQRTRLPLVTCRPFPAVRADSVTPDHFTAFQALGEHLLRLGGNRPVKFLAHAGIPSLARLHGLRAGLAGQVPIEFEILDASKGGAYARLQDLKREGWSGSVVLGVPPDEPGEVDVLRNLPWQAGSGRELAVVLETTQRLPPGVSAHQIIKPSYRMGAAAVQVLIRRVLGDRGEMRHEVVRHEIALMTKKSTKS